MPQHQELHVAESVQISSYSYLLQDVGLNNIAKAETSLFGKIIRICMSRKLSEVVVDQLSLSA